MAISFLSGQSIDGNVTIATSGVTDNLILTSTDTSAASAPDIVLYRNAAIADSDTLGVVEYKGKNGMVPSSGTPLTYNAIYSRIADASNNQSLLSINTNKGNGAGAFIQGVHIAGIGTNNSATGAILINPSNDFSLPAYNLDVNGTGYISSSLLVNGDLSLDNITNASSDTDKFVVADIGVIKYRTGAQVLADIGAAPATGGAYLPLAGGTMTGNTLHGDNVKSIYGTGNDLEIYHSGSDSYIKDSGTGDVRIVASATKIFDADQSHVQATFVDGGSVDLYYSGNKKFETTSTGVSVTGNIAMGNNSITGVNSIQGNGDIQINTSTGEHAVYGAANAQTMLYHNGVKKFETASTGVSIIGNIDLTPSSCDINMIDNGGAALEIKQGSDLYMRFITTNGGEHIEVNKNIELAGLTATSGTFSSTITANNGQIVLGGTGRIQGVDTVSASTDAANKAYVDTAVSGVPQGTVTGSGSSGRVAYWNSSSGITSDSDLTFNGSSLTVGGSITLGSAGYGQLNLQDSGTSYGNLYKYGGAFWIQGAGTGNTINFGAPTAFVQNINVNGAVDLDNLTVSNSQGTNGQVLTSSGSGVSWQTPTTGTVTGTGTSGEIAIFNGSSSVTSNAAFKEISSGKIYAEQQFQVKGVSAADFCSSQDTDTGLGQFDGANGVSLVSKSKKQITVKEGNITFNEMTATAVATTGSLNANQSNQAPTQDTLATLAVDPDGNVVRGEQEGTWTFTRAQLNATLGNTLIAAPGANKAIIVTESDWMVKYNGTGAISGNQSFDVRQANIVQSAANISTLPGARINEIINAAQGQPTNPSYGFCARDIPLTTRTYKTNVATTLNKKTSDQLPGGVISISIKLKYRIFDADTF